MIAQQVNMQGKGIKTKHLIEVLRALLGKLPEKDVVMILSLVVGIACGLAAVLLKLSIDFIHHHLVSLSDQGAYNILHLIYPGIGMLLAMLFVKYVVKDNIGHGVTKVLQAVSKNESKIKPHNMWTSMLASSVTIGFGGSVGAEAPIVYTGAAIGSNVARYMGLSYKNRWHLPQAGPSSKVQSHNAAYVPERSHYAGCALALNETIVTSDAACPVGIPPKLRSLNAAYVQEKCA